MSQFSAIDISSLKLVKYPDPRLRQVCQRVTDFDESFRALVAKMFEVMYKAGGVGLAGPQVGVAVRLFVANPSGEEGDERVYANPEVFGEEGAVELEEGCLSFPNVTAKVKRFALASIRAQDIDGQPFEEHGEDLLARIYQHETDHINGTLLIDRMSEVAKIANRRTLKELEVAFSG